MAELKAFLDALDPRAYYLFAAAVVWFATWAWRRFLPGLWAIVTVRSPAMTQLPLVVLGALISAAPTLASGQIGKIIQETIIGAILSAVSAQGIHAALKASPLPYNGARVRVDAAKAFVKAERPTPPSSPTIAP